MENVSFQHVELHRSRPAMSTQTRFLLVATVVLAFCVFSASGFIPSVMNAKAVHHTAIQAPAKKTLAQHINWPDKTSWYGVKTR